MSRTTETHPGEPHRSSLADLGRSLDRPFVVEMLERCHFPAAGTAVRCGVSGGADSLALMILAVAAGLDVTAVHVDHGLRTGSNDDASIVEAAARFFGAAFESRSVKLDQGSNLEARARAARHRELGSSAMLGHTADDQAETVLINLARGAGPAGIAAMEPGTRHPILELRRSETHGLCAELGLDPVVDPSNDDPRFVRNRVRHELLPLLADIGNRDPVPLLARSADHARALVSGVDAMATEVEVLSTAALRAAPPVVARAALRQWLRSAEGHPLSSAELDRVWAVVDHQTRACELSGGRRLSRSKGRLRLDDALTSEGTAAVDSFSENADGSVA